MPDVIADTSVLQYLHQAGLLHLLPTLYERIVIPEAVASELAVGRQTGLDVPDLGQLPWASIRRATPADARALPDPLGDGEREAIALAARSPDALLLVDDARARSSAVGLGIRCTGVLGILLRAKREGHLERVAPMLDRLEALLFRLDARTRRSVLLRAQEEE